MYTRVSLSNDLHTHDHLVVGDLRVVNGEKGARTSGGDEFVTFVDTRRLVAKSLSAWVPQTLGSTKRSSINVNVQLERSDAPTPLSNIKCATPVHEPNNGGLHCPRSSRSRPFPYYPRT